MERRVPGDASIVHQHLDRAEILGDLRDPFGAGVIVADIPFEAFDAEFLGTLVGGFVIAGVVRRYLETILHQPLGDGPTDPASSPRNKRHLCHCRLLLITSQ